MFEQRYIQHKVDKLYQHNTISSTPSLLKGRYYFINDTDCFPRNLPVLAIMLAAAITIMIMGLTALTCAAIVAREAEKARRKAVEYTNEAEQEEEEKQKLLWIILPWTVGIRTMRRGRERGWGGKTERKSSCVCVCVWERERERERDWSREREWVRERYVMYKDHGY